MNQAPRFGGAIYTSHSHITISESKFNKNAAEYGGAIFCEDSSLINVIDSSFNRNRADFGGAMAILGRSAVQIVWSVFTCNTVAIRGGALDIQYFGTMIIIGSTFSNNMAKGDGGGIQARKYEYRKHKWKYILNNNRAYKNGGALSIVYGYNVIFISNTILL